MNHQTETTVRELSLDDLDAVSGAGTSDRPMRKAGSGDASLDFPPGPNAIGPEI